MVTIGTDRLVLRPLAAGDVDAFVAYRAHPDVAAFQSWGTDFSRADAERLIAEQDGLVVGTPGEWVQRGIVERSTGTLLGDCAAVVALHQPATAEIGVTLAPESQGRGYAQEALTALLGYLFGDLDMHRVYAETDDRNAAVHRLLERVGLREEGRLVEADWFKQEWTTVRVYAVLSREWSPPSVRAS